MHALKALYHHRSPIGLLGNHIDVMTGRWTAQDAGIGGGVDSYFEYLVKGMYILGIIYNLGIWLTKRISQTATSLMI